MSSRPQQQRQRIRLALHGGGKSVEWPGEFVLQNDAVRGTDSCETLRTLDDLNRVLKRMEAGKIPPTELAPWNGKTGMLVPKEIFGQRLRLTKLLGSGSFGTVFAGRWGDTAIAMKASEFETHDEIIEEGARESMVQITLHCMLDKLKPAGTYASIPPVLFVKGVKFAFRSKAVKPTYNAVIGMPPLDREAWSLTSEFQSRKDYDKRTRLVRKVVVAIARTLHTLQKECRFMHNDLKANNVMLDKNDGVHIIDFGGASFDLPRGDGKKKTLRKARFYAVDEESEYGAVGGARRDYNTGTDMLMLLLSFDDPGLNTWSEEWVHSGYMRPAWLSKLLAPLQQQGNNAKVKSLTWRDMYDDNIASRVGPAILKEFAPDVVLKKLGEARASPSPMRKSGSRKASPPKRKSPSPRKSRKASPKRPSSSIRKSSFRKSSKPMSSSRRSSSKRKMSSSSKRKSSKSTKKSPAEIKWSGGRWLAEWALRNKKSPPKRKSAKKRRSSSNKSSRTSYGPNSLYADSLRSRRSSSKSSRKSKKTASRAKMGKSSSPRPARKASPKRKSPSRSAGRAKKSPKPLGPCKKPYQTRRTSPPRRCVGKKPLGPCKKPYQKRRSTPPRRCVGKKSTP